MKDAAFSANTGKFVDPEFTADGVPRARVPLSHPETLWFNTGTLCNIECANCYILSSPTNDALVYISEAEVRDYLAQVTERGWPISEIGFTGGEPFMNPEMIGMARAALENGFRVLILTNAMRPMMRDRVLQGLHELNDAYGDLELYGVVGFPVNLDDDGYRLDQQTMHQTVADFSARVTRATVSYSAARGVRTEGY